MKELKPVFIHSTEKLTEPKFLTKNANLVTYTRGDKLGNKHQWEVGKGFDSVHILINDTGSKELILVQQVRVPALINLPGVTDGICTEACAGLVDKYEGQSENIRTQRIAWEEVREELGYKLSSPLALTPIYKLLSAVGTKASMTHLFYCEVTSEHFVGQDLGKDEDIIELRVQYNKVQNFILESNNLDSTTVTLLQWWLLNKKEK